MPGVTEVTAVQDHDKSLRGCIFPAFESISQVPSKHRRRYYRTKGRSPASFMHILLLEDNPLDADRTLAALTGGGVVHTSVRADSREEFIAALDRGGFDLILASDLLPTFDGLAALKMAREKSPDVPFIFLSNTPGEELAVDAFKSGATDYVLKQRLARWRRQCGAPSPTPLHIAPGRKLN